MIDFSSEKAVKSSR